MHHLRVRLTFFAIAITVVLGVIAWTAYTSWSHSRRLNEQLSEVDLETFRIADHIQQEIMHMNNVVLRYSQSPQPSLWSEFQQTSDQLDRWLDSQTARLLSRREREVHQQINQTYDVYVASAREAVDPALSVTSTNQLVAMGRFERQGQRLMGLARTLAATHRESLNAILSASLDSSRLLRNLLYASLLALAICGAGLAVVVYRGLVRPLQSRLVEAQARIERHEKLASLGVLAAGVAHEIRNPLTAIKARIYSLQRRIAAGAPERAAVDIIDGEVHRLERIVRDFLEFARPADPRFEALNAGDLLREVQTLLRPELEAKGITIEVEARTDSRALADPQQLKQVLINLTQNAAEACSPGGRVELRVRDEVARNGNRASNVVAFEVADTGTGIPPDVERRLFDPFFTTKSAGTGLGLAIAARIVEKHNGSLRYTTSPGRGTVFRVVLPKG